MLWHILVASEVSLSFLNISRLRYSSFLLLILILFSVQEVLAGSSGKIAGKVIDAKTKEPLIGVNIVIVGTTLGAATDIEGKYTILDIQPKSYSLRASILGYSPVTVSDVKVSIDLTTRQDFALNESVIEGQEVLIVAERPLVQKDQTAKTATIGAEQISKLPVTEVGELISLQAGYVAGSLRGGRTGEVAYWIDGVPVTDVYDGSQVVEVNKNLIQELQLVSGAFNAEYGQALSGVVNIATKEGGKTFNGSLGVYVGDYASGATTIFPGISNFNPVAIRNFEGSLSGPIVGDDLTFFANGRYIYFDGYLHGFRLFNPSNIAYTDSTGTYVRARDLTGRGDSSEVSMNSSERAYGQGKLTYRISPSMKLSANYIYDHTTSGAYSQMFYYNPDGAGTNHNMSNTLIFQFSHSLNSNLYYTVGGSLFDKDYKYYLYESPHDSRYVHPQLFQTSDGYSFYTGGTDLNNFHRSTRTMLGKVDVSDQINQTHLMKFGIEYQQNRVTYENIQLQPVDSQSDIDLAHDSPYIQTQILDVSSLYHDYYDHRPKQFSGYVQDKMEFSDFIVNIGVRFDYFDPDGNVLNDETDPNIYDPIKPANIFHDDNGNGIQDPGETDKTVDERRTYWYRKASKKTQISPRFGASFPITAGGVVHFSYGQFFQIPRFERLYENPDFKLGFGTGNQGLVGNADLSAEQTINGELGIQQQISNDITVDVTAYLRDIRNLTGTRAEEIVVFGGSKSYSKYVNSDFGFVKGIIFTLEKRFSTGVSATVDYTYQVAQGTASDPSESRNAVLGGSLPEVQLTPLGWDQRNTLNLTASYAKEKWGMGMIAKYGSGTPYTPRRSEDISTLLTNSELKPSTFNIDIRGNYNIAVDALKIILFARVFNLLDTRNEIGVYDDTGRAGYTTDEQKALASNPTQRVNTIDQWYTRSTYYSEPRRIEIGMNLEF